MEFLREAFAAVAGVYDASPMPEYADVVAFPVPTAYGDVKLPPTAPNAPRMVFDVLSRPAVCRIVPGERPRAVLSRPMMKADGCMSLVSISVGDELLQSEVSLSDGLLSSLEVSLADEPVLWVDDDGDALTFKSLSFPMGEDLAHLVDFDLVSRLLGHADMAKAQTAIPAGARWITVHPNGEGSKGVPVLVQEHPHHKGVMQVIGGAGGKLNYLKLRGVKSPGEYAKEASERQALARQAKREQTAKDKVLGIHQSKVEARKAIQAQRIEAEKQFIQTVASAMGWQLPSVDSADAFDAPSADGTPVDPKVAKKAAQKRHRELLAHARAAVEIQRQALIADPQARQVAFAPVSADQLQTDPLDATDLVPVRLSTGTGVSPDFKERSERAGLTAEALDAEVSAIQSGGDEELAAEQKARKVSRAAVAKEVREQVEKLTASKPDLAPIVADAKSAVSLLAAHKQLQAVQAKARAATAEVDSAVEPPRQYVLAVSPVSQQQVEADVEDQLRTASARSMLEAAGKADSDELDPHIATGSFNALNAFSQTVAGAQLIDRSVVDVLGVGGAAQVLAHRLHSSMTPEQLEQVVGGLEDYHVASQTEKAASALDQVEALQAAALDMEHAGPGDDILFKAQLAARRAEHLAQANKVLGQTLGELEGHAALVAALKQKPSEVQVSLGSASLISAVRQCRALGMVPGDYELTREGANVFLKVSASGLDRLSGAMDPDNVARVRRNLDIMEGKHDEDGWLPQGFADRSDLVTKPVPGVAASLAEEFKPGDDLVAALRDHVGSRFADGESPAAILSDIQSAAYFQKAGNNAAYRAALDTVAPNKIDGKRLARAEDLAPLFQQHADAFTQARYGSTLSGLNRQTFDLDDVGQDAVHRALADHPDGVLAYKPVGELSRQEMRQVREAFGRRIAKDSPTAAGLRKQLEDHMAGEPPRFVEDMFGEQAESPDWQAWNSARSEYSDQLRKESLTWGDYCKSVGGVHKAVASVQDLIKSDFAAAFARHHNALRPGSPLRTGRATIRNNLGHLAAVDPAAREAKLAKERELMDSLRTRVAGKYASGSVSDKLAAAAEQQAAFEQAQMGFFGGDLFGAEAPKEVPLAADERHTVGHAAEQQLAAAIGVIGKQFKPGQPIKLFHASMSGPSGVARQRAIKHVVANKRSVLGLGVGSGKTGIMLGAFAHLHSTGAIKKGIFAVPSIVQGQFGAEALRFLQPGKFDFHCEPGASREERFAAYKDPGKHFAVVTHQALRDDIAHAVGKHLAKSPDDALAHLESLSPDARQQAVSDAFGAMGIKFDYAAFDEAHGLLDREGKEDSRLSVAAQALTDGCDYYAHASGDPVKNDASEVFSLLQKMDRSRYTDRDAFMRAYGGDTPAAKDALRREMARHLFADSLSPDVSVEKRTETVPLSAAQQQALSELDGHMGKVRIAKLQGKVAVDSVRALMPDHFAGLPADQHEELARELQESLPLIKESATKRILDSHPEGGKVDAIAKLAADRKDKPGVVFARSLAQVEHVRKRLEAEGHRVATISGADSSADKAAKIRGFNPDSGERAHDIVVCSDAAAVGANLQSGQWLVQSDTPDTAMVHRQRQGRIDRIGQKNAIELIDLMHDHPSEHRARKRVATKYQLRDLVTTPLAGLDDSGLAHYIRSRQVEQQQGLF